MRKSYLAVVLCMLAATSNASSDTGLEGCSISATLIDGSDYVTIVESQHSPLLLKFWATWCGTCMKEMPDYAELYSEYGKHVRFLAVNVAVDDPLEHVRATVHDLALEMPVAYDQSGYLGHRLGVSGTPAYVLLAADGKVLFRSNGHSEALEAAIRDAANLGKGPAGDETLEST